MKKECRTVTTGNEPERESGSLKEHRRAAEHKNCPQLSRQRRGEEYLHMKRTTVVARS
jgi:hypothetical protein